jgi:23S rRNA pseudoU1915 N3-methylase RlmH
MKPAWDKLMKEYEDSDTILIADADCTAGGKALCNSVGVKGYPTIKHGDPSDLQDYNGGRSASDLKKFAKGLKPSCSVANIDLCNDEEKASIEAIQAMSAEDLEADIAKGDAEMAAAEETFKESVEKLQATYKDLMEAKDAAVDAVKNSDYGLKKAVRASQKKAAKQAAKEEL